MWSCSFSSSSINTTLLYLAMPLLSSPLLYSISFHSTPFCYNLLFSSLLSSSLLSPPLLSSPLLYSSSFHSIPFCYNLLFSSLLFSPVLSCPVMSFTILNSTQIFSSQLSSITSTLHYLTLTYATFLSVVATILLHIILFLQIFYLADILTHLCKIDHTNHNVVTCCTSLYILLWCRTGNKLPSQLCHTHKEPMKSESLGQQQWQQQWQQ